MADHSQFSQVLVSAYRLVFPPSGNAIVTKLVELLSNKAASLSFQLPDSIRASVLQIRPEVIFDVVQSNYKLNSPKGSNLPMAEILSGFKDSTPNGMHYFLAHALASKIVSVVITTNYDTLIERAFETVSLFKKGSQPRLQVVASEPDLGKVQTRRPKRLSGNKCRI